MTAIIITVVVTIVLLSLVAAYEAWIPAIVEAQIKASEMEEKAALAMAEEVCRCKACLFRKETNKAVAAYNAAN